MKSVKPVKFLVSVFLCVLTIFSLSGCGSSEPEATPTPEPTPRPTPVPSTPEPTLAPVMLAPYDGAVEHIFFQEIIAWPELAFNGSSREEQMDAEYVTADEFWKVLQELHKNDYVLINLNDVYSEYMTETGHYKIRQNTLDIPVGKKPLVISFDNMNFNENIRQYGFMTRYTIGVDGEIWAEGTDPDGNYVLSQDLTAITLLDKFVNENPTFSHNGAKGCLALTGAQGILGYRTNKSDEETQETRLNRMQEVALVTPIVERLKETGWYFASHTYSRSSLGRMSLEDVKTDAERWFDEVGILVGETQILTYPASSRLDGGDQDAPGPALEYYVSIGFRYFAAYGSRHFVKIKSDDYNITAVIADRAFMCGTTFRNHRNILMRLFDVRDVFDPVRPDYGNTWED